jgi:5'(3')-deoxyribonucleotidase
MDKRELSMYKLIEAAEALLAGISIKRIARLQKVSKNTVEKYRNILNKILQDKPEIKSNINKIMNEFQEIRKKERFSENFGWLERNSKLVESLTSQCNNYIVLINKLKGNGFKGSYSSLLRYVTSKTYNPEQCCLEKKT